MFSSTSGEGYRGWGGRRGGGGWGRGGSKWGKHLQWRVLMIGSCSGCFFKLDCNTSFLNWYINLNSLTHIFNQVWERREALCYAKTFVTSLVWWMSDIRTNTTHSRGECFTSDHLADTIKIYLVTQAFHFLKAGSKWCIHYCLWSMAFATTAAAW